MVKRIDIFAPDDLEFDLTPILGEGAVYKVPGDIPTDKILKMWAIAKKLQSGEVEAIDKMKDLICDCFSYHQSEEEVKALREKLGINVMYQIENAIEASVLDMYPEEEAKNPKEEAEEKAEKSA